MLIISDLSKILFFQAIIQHRLHFKQIPSQCNEKDFSDCFLPEKTTFEHLSMSVIVGSMIALKRVQDTLAKQIAFFFSKHDYPNVLQTYLRICVRKNWGANIFVRQ